MQRRQETQPGRHQNTATCVPLLSLDAETMGATATRQNQRICCQIRIGALSHTDAQAWVPLLPPFDFIATSQGLNVRSFPVGPAPCASTCAAAAGQFPCACSLRGVRRLQHADTAVLELSLAQPLDVQEVREVQRVEAGVRTRQAAGLAGRRREERHGVHRLGDRHGGASRARGLRRQAEVQQSEVSSRLRASSRKKKGSCSQRQRYAQPISGCPRSARQRMWRIQRHVSAHTACQAPIWQASAFHGARTAAQPLLMQNQSVKTLQEASGCLCP